MIDGLNWMCNVNWFGFVGIECMWVGVGCGNNCVVELFFDVNELCGFFFDLMCFLFFCVVFMNVNEFMGSVFDV